MANAGHLIEWHNGNNYSVGYVKSDRGQSRPLYYVQRNGMDWIVDRECVRIGKGATMRELQDIAERDEQNMEASTT
jgi:hypothetical protein